MKAIYLMLVLCTALSVTSFAQIKVPANVQNAFKTKFPGATGVKWGKESAKEYEAEFKLNNTAVSANFGTDGSWKETETTISAAELPAAVTRAVNAKYPGAVMYLTEKIEKPEGKVLYEVNIKVKGKKKELEMNPDGSVAG
jgi:uncharacterized membrane protein YkoI